MANQKRATSKPVLRSTEAQLYVANVAASCTFFTSKLGFEIAFVSGDPPFYAQVCRDDARLNLRLVSEPVYAGDVREREQLLSATITVGTATEIEHLAGDFGSAGVRFQQELKREPWGATTFVVADPDGNLVLFAGPADERD
jgi:catechol 2,3-dioxygenase-like lactoylglutathione lyase family enzyme